MNLIKQPNNYSCALAAAAMAMDVPMDEIIAFLGHDGSEILNLLPSPLCHKGFHIQEIIDFALDHGYTVTPIEVNPWQQHSEHHEHQIFREPEDRFYYHVTYETGIFEGKGKNCWHTVAWDGYKVYDPNGSVYSLSDIKINIKTFWRFDKNQSSLVSKIKSI